jgi:hypothetical protein
MTAVTVAWNPNIYNPDEGHKISLIKSFLAYFPYFEKIE